LFILLIVSLHDQNKSGLGPAFIQPIRAI